MTTSKRLDESELQRVLHELQVHQRELETRNHALMESQRLLEESRARYTDFYDRAPIGYCILDREARIEEINRAAAAMLGMPRDLLVGRRFTSAATVRDTKAIEAHLARCFEGDSKVTSEVQWVLPERTPGVVQLVSCPIRDVAGSISGCRTALIDVSAEKEGEARLRLLAEAGEVFASSLDHHATLAAVTRLVVPALADVCFVDLVNEQGLERLDIVVDPHRVMPNAATRLRALPTAGSPQERVAQDGRSIVVELNGPVEDDPYDAVMREVGVTSTMIVPLEARDRIFGALTLLATRSGRRYREAERYLAEDIGRRAAMAIDNALLYERAQNALRARDAVMAVVSHDLRNPLAVIRLQAAASLKRPKDTDRRTQARTSFEAILRAARTMDQLIRDLLDVASMDAGRLSISTSRASASSIVQEAIEEAAPLAAEKQLRLVAHVEGEGEVVCDRFRIQQVFTNLLGNAVKFTPPGGAVTVRAQVGEGEVRFSVEDDGPGISEEDQRRIFEPFWQASTSDGKGLGLSIADGIVRAHGGRIWVVSTPGHGATFFFTLRRATASTVEERRAH